MQVESEDGRERFCRWLNVVDASVVEAVDPIRFFPPGTDWILIRISLSKAKDHVKMVHRREDCPEDLHRCYMDYEFEGFKSKVEKEVISKLKTDCKKRRIMTKQAMWILPDLLCAMIDGHATISA